MCNDDVQKIFDLICSDYLHFLEINKLFGKDFISFAQKKLKKENIDLRITSCFDQEDIKRKFQNDSRYHGLIKKYYMKKWLMKE